MIVRTEAFVLKAVRFGETSMIYRLFTRDRGVVPVMAKGARRPKSRFGASLGTFHRLLVTYYQKEGREVQTLLYDHLALLKPGRADELITDLRERTGLEVSKVRIDDIDLIRDCARLTITCRALDSQTEIVELPKLDRPEPPASRDRRGASAKAEASAS